MKFECVKCKATYFHNSIMKPPTSCRFCGKEMIKVKMTDEEFGEMYLDAESPLHEGEKDAI